jgi:hypothetical protein
VLMSQKRYRLTRVSKEFVWVRWEAYGHERRGLSIKIPMSDFQRDWVRLPNSLVEKRRGAGSTTPSSATRSALTATCGWRGFQI